MGLKPTQTPKTKTMLCLKSWFGTLDNFVVGRQDRCVEVFSKLGGNYLGKIVLVHTDQGRASIVETIRSLQRQGGKLMPHAELTYKCLEVSLDGKALPSMTYREEGVDFEDVAETLQQKGCLRADLRYNEDDSEALEVIKDCYYFTQDVVCVDVTKSGWFPEFEVLLHGSSAESWMIVSNSNYQTPIDLSFLGKAKSMNGLALHSVNFFTTRDIHVERLVLGKKTVCADLKRFVNLQSLRIVVDESLQGADNLEFETLKKMSLTKLVVKVVCSSSSIDKYKLIPNDEHLTLDFKLVLLFNGTQLSWTSESREWSFERRPTWYRF